MLMTDIARYNADTLLALHGQNGGVTACVQSWICECFPNGVPAAFVVKFTGFSGQLAGLTPNLSAVLWPAWKNSCVFVSRDEYRLYAYSVKDALSLPDESYSCIQMTDLGSHAVIFLDDMVVAMDHYWMCSGNVEAAVTLVPEAPEGCEGEEYPDCFCDFVTGVTSWNASVNGTATCQEESGSGELTGGTCQVIPLGTGGCSAYDSQTSYEVGDCATYGGVSYVAIAPSNSGNQHAPTDSAYWATFDLSDYWDVTAEYNEDDEVDWMGQRYRAKDSVPAGYCPACTDYWELV
jgi:hypothetical protein